jgi:proteasome beta subunit
MSNGDFFSLLPEGAALLKAAQPLGSPIHQSHPIPPQVEATTVFAFHCKDGILTVGDHRATTGNVIFTDQAEKILELDEHSVMAIAGSPAVAMEMARTLRTAFEFYRRSQLQKMSLAAKTRALAKMLRDNLPGALQGIGLVAPILAGWDFEHATDTKGRGAIYFYDPLGAHFEATRFAGSGSGSLTIKSILSYLDRWNEPAPKDLDLQEAVVLAIRVLMTAAELDSATGGVTPEMEIYPTVKLLDANGVRSITPAEQQKWWAQAVKDDSAAKNSSAPKKSPTRGRSRKSS